MSSGRGSIREKLKSEMEEVEWDAIHSHAERGAVILISEELDLLDVAETVAQDEKNQIEKWVGLELMRKPDLAEIDRWNEAPQQKFRFVILAPFILVQRLAH